MCAHAENYASDTDTNYDCPLSWRAAVRAGLLLSRWECTIQR